MLRYYPSEYPIYRIKIVLDGVSLDQLRAFIAAVDEGSFSAGARKLHRAQSAVSELVSNLEAQLGVALFDRSERYPKLTSAGVQLLADARGVGHAAGERGLLLAEPLVEAVKPLDFVRDDPLDRARDTPMIAVQHLVKQYGKFTAVDDVSLDVQPGEIHGFLGPNGAGKTTTLRMIAGLLKPTSGRVIVNGHDVAAEPELAKASLGFIPDRPFIYEKLTAGEFLKFHAGLYGLDGDGVMDRVHEMLDLFELRRWENELVESFSHGMKQRLVMCAAFLHRPRAVAVDEPMVGLDPRGARLIKDVFRRMSERGVAILMSTHTLEVAQEMCQRLSIILKGKIIAQGTVDEVRRLGGADDHLTSVFLRLTGGSALQEIDEVV